VSAPARRGGGVDRAGDVGELVGAVLHDAETLAVQHADLLRAELRHNLADLGLATASVVAGAALTATASVLATLMFVHKLERSTRLPLWGCYGLVGGVAGAVGTGLLWSGVERARGVDPVPRETLAAVREDYQWVKDQAARFSG